MQHKQLVQATFCIGLLPLACISQSSLKGQAMNENLYVPFTPLNKTAKQKTSSELQTILTIYLAVYVCNTATLVAY